MGHLVLSTLHTNDATGALTRLLDLGIAPYLIASTVEAVLAQRLVRKICSRCAVEGPSSRDTCRALSTGGADLTSVWRGLGCEQCRGTGYRGRTGIYELLVMNDDLRAALVGQRSARELRGLAAESGMVALLADALRLIRDGTTTPDEVVRICQT